MDHKPRFVEGIVNAATQDICWRCMTIDEYEDPENTVTFFDTEFDFPAWCHRCESPIDIPLTRDGQAYLKEMLEEPGRVKNGELDISPWKDYLEEEVTPVSPSGLD